MGQIGEISISLSVQNQLQSWTLVRKIFQQSLLISEITHTGFSAPLWVKFLSLTVKLLQRTDTRGHHTS